MLRAGFQALAVIAATCMVGSTAEAASAIDTTSSGSQGNFTGFGPAFVGTTTYGQTFTVGADNRLDSFSMFLAEPTSSTIGFKAYVYGWDGAKASGPALFTSGIQQYSGSSGAPVAFDFATGGIGLNSGSKYVAFLSTTGVPNAGTGEAGMPFAGRFGSDVLAGGEFVFTNNDADFGALTRDPWDCAGCTPSDVFFRASFSQGSTAVPEPASWAMMIGGFALAGAFMRRGRRVVAVA